MSEEVSREDDGGRFINLWDLFTQIGKAEDLDEYEAARILVSCLSKDLSSIKYIRCRDERGIPCSLGLRAYSDLLQLLSIFGDHATLPDADDRPTDDAITTFERYGYYASDIYPFLARNDIAVFRPGDKESERVFPNGRQVPGWVLTYDAQAWIPRGRATAILTASAIDAHHQSPEYYDEFVRWSNALSDAIEHRTIGLTTVSDREMLAHADVIAWCAEYGFFWPLEAPNVRTEDKANAIPPADLHTQHSAHDDSAGKLRRREQQIRFIEEMADELKYPRLQIPYLGQKAIRELCEKRAPQLFTGNAHTFKGIWDDALATNRIKMANHNVYARRF